MNRLEHILTTVAEEAVEVAQRATKMLRFGVDEIQPGNGLTNAQRLVKEYYDLNTMMFMLEKAGVVIMDEKEYIEHAAMKEARFEEYLKLSEKQGTLTKD